ncbi:hypothetical protein [Streptomyces johnsoniae]|uniref:hypothetical protein n=1 Tax=Streptomyces johnsoniae TaxID=3075532 RepID=UPI002889449B|nr:hypothetical protein [Streptomyces sp. DSM 41886]
MSSPPEVTGPVRPFEAATPLGRVATVDEMLGPADFPLGEAASFVTGANPLAGEGFTCRQASRPRPEGARSRR